MDITITATATLVELTRNALLLAGGSVARELWTGLVATLAENRTSTVAGLLALLAWGCAVLTLFALTSRERGGGVGSSTRRGATGPAESAGERVALPPRRVLTARPAPAPAMEPVAAEAPADDAPDLEAPVLETPHETSAGTPQHDPRPTTGDELVAPAAAAGVTDPSPGPLLVETAPSRQAANSSLPSLSGSRCRRCTQPRCWPSTGERSPARTLGVSAPRGCRAPIAATPGARCLPASEQRHRTCGARGPFRELTPVHRSGPPRGRGPRRHLAAP